MLTSIASAMAADWPPSGEYQVESETVMTTSAGPVVQRVTTLVRGDSGNVIVTRSSSLDARPFTSTHSGAGPVLHCVRAGTPPLPAAGCGVQAPGKAGLATASQACAAAMPAGAPGGAAPVWRRLGPQSWEVRQRLHGATPTPSTHPMDASALLKSPIFANMPAAEREALRAELAQQQAEGGASAQNAVGLAAQARQDAAAAGQALGASAAHDGVVWEITQRWTAKGRACSR